MPRILREPDRAGHFGPYGGVFVPETLMAPLTDLEREFRRSWKNAEFRREFRDALRDYVGRATPVVPGVRR
jgi:tryptophan synthase beta chain